MPLVDFKQKGGRGRFAFSAVTLLRSGGLNLNDAAYQQIGRAESVVLAYDSEGGRIGLRAAKAGEEYAYPVRKVSADAYWIAAQGFMRYYGLENKDATLRYKATTEGGYLVVDLGSEPVHRERRAGAMAQSG